MAETQNNKKGPAKGKKVKKGSPKKRSFFFKPATMILALLTILLLVLGILYLSRVQHWFSSPVVSITKEPLPSTEKFNQDVIKRTDDAKKMKPAEKKESFHKEEYQNVPRSRRAHHKLMSNENGPSVAIIIDDLGLDLVMMKKFMALQLNVTAAVLPHLPHTRDVAELAHTNGREVLLHIPMEPRDYPAVNPGAEALTVDLSSLVVEQRLREYLQEVPWAVGANNHMGSRFTESKEGMRSVLQLLKDRGLFFIDSRTTSDSVAVTEAVEMGIANGERDLFLDNELNVTAIRAQIQRLIRIAKEDGSAIGICHPHEETYTALKLESASFAASGVKLVSVSSLVH